MQNLEASLDDNLSGGRNQPARRHEIVKPLCLDQAEPKPAVLVRPAKCMLTGVRLVLPDKSHQLSPEGQRNVCDVWSRKDDFDTR